jgi:ATP-dependent protease Clp ATPase subunit
MECGFCGSAKESVSALVAGPGAYICADCVAFAESTLADADQVVPVAGSSAGSSAVELRCSFCDRSAQRVRRLIAGPDVRICDGCVRLAVDALAGRSDFVGGP